MTFIFNKNSAASWKKMETAPGAKVAAPTTAHVIARIAAALLGSYLFVWGTTAFGVAAGTALGLDLRDAEALLYLFVFLLIPACFCWAFVHRSLARVWLVLAGGGALMTLAAWFIARSLA